MQKVTRAKGAAEAIDRPATVWYFLANLRDSEPNLIVVC